MDKLYFVNPPSYMETLPVLECTKVNRETKCYYIIENPKRYLFTNRVKKEKVDYFDYFTSPDGALKKYHDQALQRCNNASNELDAANKNLNKAKLFVEKNESKF